MVSVGASSEQAGAEGSAMPDINLDINYFDRPEVKRLVGLLGRGTDVLPIRLWTYTAKVRAEDGRLIGHAAQEIESIAGWWGESGKMVRTMLLDGIRFLGQDEDGTFFVPNWLDEQGHLSAFHKRAKKAAHDRWDKIKNGSNASSMPQACLKHSPRPTESKTSSSGKRSRYSKPGPAFGPPSPAAASLRSELTAAGVGEPSLSRCAAVPGMTPIAVLILAKKADKEADHPPGWIVSKILAPDFSPPKLIAPEDVARIANAGDVKSICGHAVDGRITFSHDWIEVGSVRIRSKDLTAEAIELTPEETM